MMMLLFSVVVVDSFSCPCDDPASDKETVENGDDDDDDDDGVGCGCGSNSNGSSKSMKIPDGIVMMENKSNDGDGGDIEEKDDDDVVGTILYSI